MFSALLNLALLPFRAVGTVLMSILTLLSYGVAAALMPPFGKRLILTVSLYAHLRELDARHASQEQILATIRELVAILHLTPRSERSLMFPVLLAEYIWDHRKVPVREVLSQPHTVPWSCERIIGATPKGLRYDREQMRRDITCILTGCREKANMGLTERDMAAAS